MGVFDFLKKPKDHGFEGKYVTYQKVYNPPGQHMRILRESMDICMKTVNPDTFFLGKDWRKKKLPIAGMNRILSGMV